MCVSGGLPTLGSISRLPIAALVWQGYEYCTGSNTSLPQSYLDLFFDALSAQADALNSKLGTRVIVVPPRQVNVTFADVHRILEALSFELYTLQFFNATAAIDSITPLAAPGSALPAGTCRVTEV
jgi:hypothetical protein